MFPHLDNHRNRHPTTTSFGFHRKLSLINKINHFVNLPVQQRFQVVEEREVGVSSVRDGLVAPEPSAGRHVVVQHPIIATLGYPPAVGLVLTAEQFAERPDLLYRGRVRHCHGHGGHKRRAGGGRGRRGGRRGRRLLLLLGGRVFFLGCPRFRRCGRGRSASA